MSKTVWITGASSGIGEALAIEWSRRGARVILSARSREELERVRSLCVNPAAHFVRPLDLTDGAAIRDVAAEVLREVGAIDILVHSAGVSQRSLAAETDMVVDRAIMELNYFGAIALTKAVLPSMLARKSGTFVPISSVIGYVAIPTRSAYSASKHALHGFFEALRAETAKDGIRVTMVVPGYVRTRVSNNALKADGTPHGVMDDTHQKAMPPGVAAKKIIDAVESGKAEVRLGGKEIYAVLLRRFFPGLLRKIVRVK